MHTQPVPATSSRARDCKHKREANDVNTLRPEPCGPQYIVKSKGKEKPKDLRKKGNDAIYV